MDSIQSADPSEEDWYNMPLYYDIIFDQETSREAEFLERMVSLHAARGELGALDILEPACGSGRLMELLSGMGHRVTGFDMSPAMIEFSRNRLLLAGHEPRLYQMGMEEFQIPGKFDMAYCLVSTFKYLLNGRMPVRIFVMWLHTLGGGAFMFLASIYPLIRRVTGKGSTGWVPGQAHTLIALLILILPIMHPALKI